MWREFVERPGFVVGLDLGQANDFTAITVADRVVTIEREARGIAPDRRAAPVYEVGHLKRFALGTGYPEIAQAVGRLLVALPQRRYLPELVVDATGVGRPVVDLLKKARLRPIAVSITGGFNETTSGDFAYGVPKRNLVSALQVVLQSGRLKIARELPDAATLVDELQNFKVKISASGHDSYEAWRESVHDDLVLSASLAVWYAERHLRYTSSVTELKV